MLHRQLPFVALVLLAATVARADQIDDFIETEMQRQRIPGLSLAVVKDGEIIKAAGYGVADRKLKTPATPETVYKIASVSKQFIATGIMRLMQEHRIGLDEPISKYLEGTPPTWQAITIRHLLTHTSGLVRESPGFDPLKVQSDADVVKASYPLQLRFSPGEKWEYGNVAYYALAEIIRRVSGQPWTEYLTQQVFKPSGMLNTYPTNTKTPVSNPAKGYVDNDKLLDADEWTALRPSGAFISTVLDLAKWDSILYTDKILSESTRGQMWTPAKLNDGTSCRYGFGWMLDSFRGHRLVHHSGGMPGFRSEFARFVDDRLTIIFLTNLNDVDPGAILQGVSAFYLR
jgi:CubicO group peptidase (beta-lactamase class C family)